VGQGDSVFVELNDSDFGTAQKWSTPSTPSPRAAPGAGRPQIRCVRRTTPARGLSRHGSKPATWCRPSGRAKVIVNSRTGSVVMNQKVALQNCAVSHGSLTVTIGNEQQVSQPNAFSGGQTAVTNKGGVDIKQEGGNIFNVKGGSSSPTWSRRSMRSAPIRSN
jgi:flagellar P-ring protein precursor FlgI